MNLFLMSGKINGNFSNKKCEDNNKENIGRNLLLIITQMIAAVTKLFTLHSTHVILTFNVEHRVLCWASSARNATIWNIYFKLKCINYLEMHLIIQGFSENAQNNRNHVKSNIFNFKRVDKSELTISTHSFTTHSIKFTFNFEGKWN